MSLIKKHEMTEKQLAANRQNQKLAHGPVTDEGRERIRAAHLRHGFYLQDEEVAMRALGEDPARFQELVQGLWEEYAPTGAAQEGLVIRLARSTWLMNRADRMQEGCAVRQAQDVNIGRQDRLHVQMMRLKMTAKSLELLAQSVAREYYVTTPEDLEKMKNLHQEGVLKEMGEIALALFYQLQEPGTNEDGLGPEEHGRNAVNTIKAIFGISPDPAPEPSATPDSTHLPEGQDAQYPNITVAEWEAREQPRQLLENILTRHVDICEAQRQALLKESVKGPSPYERAAEIAPTQPQAMLMRRMQDSYFREIRRVTNLLLKMKRGERKAQAGDENDELNDGEDQGR